MNGKLDELNTQFVEFVLSEDIKSEDIKIKKFENILNVAEKLYNNHKWHVPYDVLTQEIYKKPKAELDRLYFIAMENFSNLAPSDFIEQIKNDTLRNIRLAVCQKKYITENIKNANEKLEEMNDKAQTIKSEFNTVQDGLKKIKDLRSKIYTDFITILGIFSALLFGMFGGFDSLKEILSNLHNTSISTTLICFSSLMLGLLCLIFLLVQSIARLTGKDTLGCEHHGIDEHCSCSIIRKYPVFIYLMLLFSTILIISCVIRFIDYSGLYKVNLWCLIIVAIVGSLFIWHKVNKSKKKKLVAKSRSK